MSKSNQNFDANPELEVDEQTTKRHTALIALQCILDGDFTEDEALEVYELTKEDLDAHRAEFESLKD